MRVSHYGYLHQITFLPGLFPVNCYFVENEDGGLTLMDTALPFSAKGIVHAAESLKKPITRIILTHAHGDHIGALDSLKDHLPNVPVYISHRDARLLGGNRTLDKDEPQTPIKGAVPKPDAIRTKPDILLNDGDSVGTLLAIATPGHTPGSMSFLDTRNQSLIAGDAFQTRGGFAVSGQLRMMFPFPAMATWSKERALQSARRIMEYKPTLIAVGHGNVIEKPIELLKRALAQ